MVFPGEGHWTYWAGCKATGPGEVGFFILGLDTALEQRIYKRQGVLGMAVVLTEPDDYIVCTLVNGSHKADLL